MPPHNVVPFIRPRTLAHVLLDLKEARGDWEHALADAERADREGNSRLEIEAGDRMSEADKRIDDLRDEFARLFHVATGLTWKQVEEAVAELVL